LNKNESFNEIFKVFSLDTFALC